MSVLEALPTCRRKSLFALGLGLANLVLAWAAHVGNWPISERGLGMLAGVGAGGVFAAALLWFMPDTSGAAPKALMRRYYREFIPAMAAYVAVMLVWRRLLDWVQIPALRVVVALLPALLVIWVMRAFVRFVRDSDEMQRRIELESGAVGALLVSAGFLASGFLQSAKLIDVPSSVAMLWVFPMLCFTYGIAKVFISRRYQ